MDWNQCVVFDWHWLPGYDAAEPQWETIKKEELAGEATLQAQMRSILRMLLAWRRLEIFDDRNREWWWNISSIAFYRIKTITNLLTNINRCRQISFLCVTSVWKFWKGTWGTILYRVLRFKVAEALLHWVIRAWSGYENEPMLLGVIFSEVLLSVCTLKVPKKDSRHWHM